MFNPVNYFEKSKSVIILYNLVELNVPSSILEVIFSKNYVILRSFRGHKAGHRAKVEILSPSVILLDSSVYSQEIPVFPKM